MPAAPSRSTTRGRTARASSSAICRSWWKVRRRAPSRPRPPRSDRKEALMTDTSLHALDRETITKAYARWAPIYDLVFGAVFERGREAAIAAAERIGGRILEVGV